MRNLIGPVLPVILVFLAMSGLSYPLWKLNRWFHYKYSYQAQVEKQMAPLVVRIENLEKRVLELEQKK